MITVYHKQREESNEQRTESREEFLLCSLLFDWRCAAQGIEVEMRKRLSQLRCDSGATNWSGKPDPARRAGMRPYYFSAYG
jgi:hypothetical protein